MSKTFSQTEVDIQAKFKPGTNFIFKQTDYTVLISGKPSPSKGECKTDLYILAENKNGKTIEIKVSIKQHNADFLENKMSLERAIQIFGDDAQSTIEKSILKIKQSFLNDFLVTFNKYGKTEAKTLKIGWKFELLNKGGGDKCGLLQLTDDQKLNVYAGTNLTIDKKNSKVNGLEIVDSGIANYIFELEDGKIYSSQTIIDNLQDMNNFVVGKNIYFACKAINYRVTADKWDGNRPLSVYVNWSIVNDQLLAKIMFSNPLGSSANDIGNNIKSLLKILKIDDANFYQLKNFLHDVKYYE